MFRKRQARTLPICPYCQKPIMTYYADYTVQQTIGLDPAQQQAGESPVKKVDFNNIMSTCSQVMSTVSQMNQFIRAFTGSFK
ncbi:YppG family protein [Jeotgalibacillus aurantiacus]|uniref:YppG family protein n=1 Tax=Jeotgalibacillus aurantiacus TaxID=2763266 RepID=UPI001D0A3766|nr:YppG family protein [Jeotgalibacillus aurantiacus]